MQPLLLCTIVIITIHKPSIALFAADQSSLSPKPIHIFQFVLYNQTATYGVQIMNP